MTKYFFHIVRYIPNELREEFLNIGIVLISENRTYSLFFEELDRLNSFSPCDNPEVLRFFFNNSKSKKFLNVDSLMAELPNNLVLSPIKSGETDLPIQDVFYELYVSLVKPVKSSQLKK